MVTGFEKITSELNKFEQDKILPIVIRIWEKKPVARFSDEGKLLNRSSALVNMKQMVKGMNNVIDRWNEDRLSRGLKKYSRITEPRMRKIIHHIRVNALVPNLIATSIGYHKTDSVTRMENYIKSCRERANSFKEVERAMEKQKEKLTYRS